MSYLPVVIGVGETYFISEDVMKKSVQLEFEFLNTIKLKDVKIKINKDLQIKINLLISKKNTMSLTDAITKTETTINEVFEGLINSKPSAIVIDVDGWINEGN